MALEQPLWRHDIHGRITYYPNGSSRERGNCRSDSPPPAQVRQQTAYAIHASEQRVFHFSLRTTRTFATGAGSVGKNQRRGREIHALLIKQNSAEEVLEVAAASSSELHTHHVVTALHRAAKFHRCVAAKDGEGGGLSHDQRWRQLVVVTHGLAAEMPPMSLALAAWALATTKHHDSTVLSALGVAFTKRSFLETTAHDLSGMVWAFATLENFSDQLFGYVASATAMRLQDNFLPQDMSLVVWAFARVVVQSEPLFDAVAAAATVRHAEFGGQNLANLMWSFGQVPHTHAPMLASLTTLSIPPLPVLGTVELSTILWTCASLSHNASELFTQAAARICGMQGEFEPQQLSSIVWAYARIGFRNRRVFMFIGAEIVGRKLALGPTELNRVAWAFAYPGRPEEERTGRLGGFRDAPLLAHLSKQAQRTLQSLDSLHMSSIAWSFATLTYPDTALFDSLSIHVATPEIFQKFDTQNIAYLLWALARLRVCHPGLFKCASDETVHRGLHVFDHRHLSMLLWAFARSGDGHSSLWGAVAVHVPSMCAQHIGHAQGVASLAMVLHALHQVGERETSLALLKQILAIGVDISGDAYGGWLADCQATKDADTELVVWEHMLQTAPNHGLRAAAGNMAVLRALELNQTARARQTLATMEEHGLSNVLSVARLRGRCSAELFGGHAVASPLGWKPRQRSDGIRQARAAGRILSKWDYYKEVGVLEYVFSRATYGDAATVCLAIESFSREEHLYLKLGAEEKGLALDAMLRSVSEEREGPVLVVEIGCYVGYSAVRMSQCLPTGSRLVTIEVDPYHAAISRSVLEMSGLAHLVEIWIGHSEHVIPRLSSHFGCHCTNAIFFDQRGTRYHEDLELLERLHILAHGAIVCADNVVRPGAPEFMWRVCDPRGCYETQAIAHRDYGQDSVEDWISISRFCPAASLDFEWFPCPEALRQLAYESDQMRNRSINERVTEEEWRVFTLVVREEFDKAGIRPPVLRPQGGIQDLYVELLPWKES